MYENITFESIVKRMLSSVPDSVDKREGSIIYDAIAPIAVEIGLMYIELDTVLRESFGDTASREYLIRRAAERGIVPYTATYAVVKGEFDVNVNIGDRFSCNGYNYVVVEKIEDKIFGLKCETVGSDGNRNSGELVPVEYIKGLTSANITKLLIPAEDDESTENIRKRYFGTFESKAYGGNKRDYIEKVNSIAGVGVTKVTPVWNGGGTVKITILDSEWNVASDELVEYVQQCIDPNCDGMGIGIAPIGHIVTVETASELIVDVVIKIELSSGYLYEDVDADIKSTISNYLLEIRKEWGSEYNSVIRIEQIKSRVMNIKGIVDIEKLMINGVDNNITLESLEVPVIGGVVCE